MSTEENVNYDKMHLLDMKTQLLMGYMENADGKNDEWLRVQIKETLQQVDRMLETVIRNEEMQKRAQS